MKFDLLAVLEERADGRVNPVERHVGAHIEDVRREIGKAFTERRNRGAELPSRLYFVGWRTFPIASNAQYERRGWINAYELANPEVLIYEPVFRGVELKAVEFEAPRAFTLGQDASDYYGDH